MARVTEYQRAAREGVLAAQREHQRLATDLRQRVEIFDIIEDRQIWLLFLPLQNLYGSYQRYGEAAGILINSQHPLTTQRYTAAHEYGHYILGHPSVADDEEQVLGPPQGLLREVEAQAFAGEFLMPLQLVNYTLRMMGLSGPRLELTSRQVYQLALELGVSYLAAVTQLMVQHKISRTDAGRLRRESPLAVKESITGIRPADSWADVWLLDESQEGRRFIPRLRDEVHITLAETPSTGYVWQLAEADPSVLVLVNDQFEPDGDRLIGPPGRRHLVFRVVGAGESSIRLEKRRPWQQQSAPRALFRSLITAVASSTGGLTGGLSEGQKEAVLAGGRAA